MGTFCDSSALVKLYADEEDAELVRSLDLVVVSELARVEVPAALWRKRNIGALAAEQARVLCDAFEDDWYSCGRQPHAFTVVPVTPDILDAAARRIELHGLRAYDAVQLTAAVAARSADPDVTVFACFDASLNRVARLEGFDVLGRSAAG